MADRWPDWDKTCLNLQALDEGDGSVSFLTTAVDGNGRDVKLCIRLSPSHRAELQVLLADAEKKERFGDGRDH